MRKILFPFLSVQPPDHFVSHCRPFLLEAATLPSVNTAYLPLTDSFLIYRTGWLTLPIHLASSILSSLPWDLTWWRLAASSLFPRTIMVLGMALTDTPLFYIAGLVGLEAAETKAILQALSVYFTLVNKSGKIFLIVSIRKFGREQVLIHI
jgi:hypothetical protein